MDYSCIDSGRYRTNRRSCCCPDSKHRYPNCVHRLSTLFRCNEGDILRQLRNLRRTISSFQARMAPSTLRGHDEARLEISRLQEKSRVFLQFHRSQIARYLAGAVMEGHRNLQKKHLRKKSNEAIMPLLVLMHRFKAENFKLG